MKETGRSLMAFAVVQLLGTLGLALGIRGACILDPLAMILVLAGNAVSHGSRSARVLAAMISLLYLLIGLGTVVNIVVQKTGNVAVAQIVWQLGMAVWALINLVLLVRRCELIACLPRYTLRTLLLVVLLLSVVWKGYRWLYEQSLPPSYATVEVIEHRYAPQLARLRMLAEAGTPPSAIEVAPDNPTNVALFGRKEILVAEMGTFSDDDGLCHSGMRLKEQESPYRIIGTTGFPGRLDVEHPIVLVWKARDRSGKEHRVAAYTNSVVNQKGKASGYTMEFDLDLLGEMGAEHETEPNASPQ